jgi:hypothetical protein
MPWRDPHTVPLTRIDIASLTPSDSAVYAIMDGQSCILVGEAWNLRARLLELVNVLQDVGEFSVIYELCPEQERQSRKDFLSKALIVSNSSGSSGAKAKELPGISFRDSISR